MNGSRKKRTALVLAALLLALMLAGCGSRQCISCGRDFRSGGYKTGLGYMCDDCYQTSGAVMGSARTGASSGVWVAIVVMVFVAVLAATSGVVYIVLRQRLEQKKPAPRRSQPQPPVRRSQPPKAVPHQSPAASAQQDSFWICPNDRSRNTGRFCVVCGAPRPAVTPPRAADPPASPRANQERPANPAARPQSGSPAFNRSQAAPAVPRYREPASPIFNYDEAVVEPSRNPVKPASAVRPQPAAAPPQPKPAAIPVTPAAPAVPAPPTQTRNKPPLSAKPAAPVTPPPAVPAKKGFRTAYIRPAGQEETSLLSEIIKSGEQSE